jgi:hypothetical protein
VIIQLVYSVGSMVDLLSAIPIWFISTIPDIGKDPKTPEDSFLLCMYGFSLTRILRALRVINVENSIRDPVTKSLLEYSSQFLVAMVFSKCACVSICLFISTRAFIDAALMNFLEQDQDLKFHGWIYFIWVTTATVGYGDIT